MGGLFASMAVRWALDKLTSFLPAVAASSSSTMVSMQSQDVELLKRLERTMCRILATLHDAEEHWDIHEESTKLRLKELKELAYAAEDVVEEYANEVDRCELQATAASVSNGKRKHQEYENEVAAASFSNSKRKRQEENETYFNDGMVAVPNELVVQARKIIERFDEIIEYSVNFTLSENDGERRSAPEITTLRKTSSVVYERSIIGREEDKNKIVEKLMSIQGNNVACPVSVLALVGMGGLGKTSIAQLVYNDARVRQSFDVCVWVCVSEQFDVSTITKHIISSITKASCDLSELGDLQEKLVDEMKEKRVLLVLDDVWNERRDAWELLCVPMSTTRVCKIIVTTRSEAVARLMQTIPFYRINCLSPEESWSLFKQVAFVAHQDNDTPVNLVNIGKHIVKRCKGLPLAIKTLGSILRYETDEMRWRDVLESELWNLEKSRNEVLPALELSYKHMPMYLKRCFVALSLFPKDYELRESHVFQLWKSLDLLQCDRYEEEGDTGIPIFNELVQRSFIQVYIEQIYKMHNLIHDLACFLAAEEFFRFEGDKSIKIPPNVRYISTIEAGASVEILTASHSLRAVVILEEGYGNTQNMEVSLLNWKKIRSITCFGRRILLPCRIGHGINLRTLPEIRISRHGCFSNITELRSLNKIRELYICGLGDVARVEDAEGAQLQSKKHLRSLTLDFGSNIKGEPVTLSHEQILGSLRPHLILRKLELGSYGSQKYPSWLGNASFSNLTEIRLLACKSQHLPTLGELPSLKSLTLFWMNQMEYIGREFCSHIPGVKGFPSLTHLDFIFLPELSEWSEVDVGDFPCLQTLSFKYANKLRALPSVPFMSLATLHLMHCGNLATIPAFSTLRELDIKYCEGLHQLPTLVSLWKLEIVDCPKLSAVGSLHSLTTLNIGGPFDDEKMQHRLVNCHSSLKCITVICEMTRCISLQPQTLPSLTKLQLSCPNLHYCDGLAGLTSLRELKVWGCPKLPTHSFYTRQLQNLDIRDCRAWSSEEF